MRRSTLLAVPLLLAALPATAGAAAGNLYVQRAAGGTLKGTTLTLHGVDARTTVFADRPARSTSTQATRSFVGGWQQTFGSDAPNAALEIDAAPTSRDVAVLELRSARYDARRHTLRFQVRRLTRAGGGLAPLDRRADRGVGGRFGHASLFIDDGSGAQSLGTVLVALSAPSGQTAAISFSDAAFDIGDQEQAISYTPLTPATAPQLIITPTSLAATASNGDGGVLVQGWLTLDAGQSAITGTASLPAGSTATFQLIDGGPQPISDGPFSIPVA